MGIDSVSTTATAERTKGPLVWLDMDQKALDDAYDQAVYAPNMLQVIARCEHVGDLVRERIGEPKRLAYGPSAIEGLDLYATKTANAPVNIYVHGGAWRVRSAPPGEAPGRPSSRLYRGRGSRA